MQHSRSCGLAPGRCEGHHDDALHGVRGRGQLGASALRQAACVNGATDRRIVFIIERDLDRPDLADEIHGQLEVLREHFAA